jgi:2'-5' RNA ligase
MADQLSFMDLAPQHPARPPGNVYLALLPDEPAAARCSLTLRQIRRDTGLRGSGMDGRFHVSLQGFGESSELTDEFVEEVKAAASTVAAAPFEVLFDRVVTFGRDAIVLRGPEHERPVRAFFASLGAGLTQVRRLRRAAWSFRPHLTLIYANQRLPERQVEPIGWTVRDFVLVRSHHGHEVLGRWFLRG